jgi:hypothetical protein
MRRYIKLHTVILDNDKMAGLSSDAARWHYVKLLLHGKMTEPEGRWRSMSLLRSAVGPETFAYVPEYLATEPEGLLIERESGEVAIRQWWLWQGSDLNARRDDLGEQQQERKRQKEREKKARYRARQRELVPQAVHRVSTDVHPNRETESLTVDVDGTSADAPVPPRHVSTASGSNECLWCGKPVESLADNSVAVLRTTGRPFRIHGDCVPSMIDADGGIDHEAFHWTDYDKAGHPIEPRR